MNMILRNSYSTPAETGIQLFKNRALINEIPVYPELIDENNNLHKTT